MPDCLQLVRAVHPGRVEKFRVYPYDSRDIDDGRPAEGLPDAQKPLQEPYLVHIPQDARGRRLDAELPQDHAHEAVHREKGKGDTVHRNPAYEVRQRGGGLDEFLEMLPPDLIEQDGEHHRKGRG